MIFRFLAALLAGSTVTCIRCQAAVTHRSLNGSVILGNVWKKKNDFSSHCAVWFLAGPQIAWNVPAKLDGFASSDQCEKYAIHDDENAELLKISGSQCKCKRHINVEIVERSHPLSNLWYHKKVAPFCDVTKILVTKNSTILTRVTSLRFRKLQWFGAQQILTLFFVYRLSKAWAYQPSTRRNTTKWKSQLNAYTRCGRY